MVTQSKIEERPVLFKGSNRRKLKTTDPWPTDHWFLKRIKNASSTKECALSKQLWIAEPGVTVDET